MSASTRAGWAALALAALVAAAPAQADPIPEATHIRLVGASLAFDGAPAAVDGTVLTPSLAFGATTAAVPIAAGRHTVTVGSASMALDVPQGCTLNVIAAERGFRAPAALVPVPACGNGRIRSGASRVTVLVASDEPGRVRATLGDATPVEVAPFQMSAPLEPAAGPAKFAVSSAASGAVYASADSNLAAGTSTLVLFVGKGDQGFRLVPIFDGVQPQSPPADIEINTGFPAVDGTAAPLAAFGALAGVLGARRRRGRVWKGAAVAVVAAVSLVGCSSEQLAGDRPEVPVPASAPPASMPATPPPSRPPLAPAVPPPAWGFNAPLPHPAPAPRRVRIVQLGIDAVVSTLATSAAPGLVTLLPGPDAAYLSGTFTPGTVGVSVLVGHTGTGGVFGRLSEVAIGTEVVVTDVEGTDRRFVVLSRRAYTKGALPEELWSPELGREPILVLVSCTGPLRADGLSRDNAVIVARMV